MTLGEMLQNNQPWRVLAKCAGMGVESYDFFFPPEHSGPEATERAKRFCMDCPVREECLEAAMQEEAGHGRQYMYGVRGGTSVRDRIKLRMQRRVDV